MSDGGYNALKAAVRKGGPGAPVMLEFARVPGNLTGVAMGMGYKDRSGRVSRRWVTIRSVDIADDTLWAYCWRRRDLRSFRLDRIRDVVDGAGEVRDAKTFLASIGYLGPINPNPTGGATKSGFSQWSAGQQGAVDDAPSGKPEAAPVLHQVIGGLVGAAVVGLVLWLVL